MNPLSRKFIIPGVLIVALFVLAPTAWALVGEGIDFELTQTSEYWVNTIGGLKRQQTYLKNLDVIGSLDTAETGLWENGHFLIHLLMTDGGKKLSAEITGDIQTASNIEAPRTFRLFEASYEHIFLQKKLSSRAGILDMNSDFYVSEYAGLFINSSFGIGPEVSSGARPSIFTLASLGARLRYNLNERWQWLGGVYDGDPGDPEKNEHYPDIRLTTDQGAFIINEVIYSSGTAGDSLPGTIKIGYWHNSGDFEHLTALDSSGNPLIRRHNRGGYIIADKLIYQEKENQGLGCFLQAGKSRNSLNEVSLYSGGGLHYTGLIPGRDKDIFGLAVAHAMLSPDLSSQDDRYRSETTGEWTYRAQVNNHIILQPNMQFILHPGADKTLNNAFISGLRLEIFF